MLNETAPPFSLKSLDGKRVSLNDLRGKIVVLDFWATWCVPCKQAFPGMHKLIAQYRDQQDVVFLFIDTQEMYNSKLENEIRTYLKLRHYPFTVLLDERNNSDIRTYKIAGNYGAASIPLKVVIDKNGLIRFRSTGFPGSDEEVVKELSARIEAVRSIDMINK